MTIHLFKHFTNPGGTETPLARYHDFARLNGSRQYQWKNSFTLYSAIHSTEALYGQILSFVNCYGTPEIHVYGDAECMNAEFGAVLGVIGALKDNIASTVMAFTNKQRQNNAGWKSWVEPLNLAQEKYLEGSIIEADFDKLRVIPEYVFADVKAYLAQNDEYQDAIEDFCAACLHATNLTTALTHSEWFDGATPGMIRKAFQEHFMSDFFISQYMW